MSATSLFGGGGDSLSSQLSSQSLETLNNFLFDSVLESVITQVVGGGAVLLQASGSQGETQSVITPPKNDITMSMSMGESIQLSVALPAGQGLANEAKADQSPEEVHEFLTNQVSAVFSQLTGGDGSAPPTFEPGSDQQQQFLSINNAISDMLEILVQGGANSVNVQVVSFLSFEEFQNQAPRPGEIFFDATGSKGETVFAFNLYGTTKTVAIKDVGFAVLAEAGSVRIDGNTAARVQGDIRNQAIEGGGGNDTLVGGGGNDTLTGGGGSDIFGFNALGHYIINDATVGADKFAFDIPGVTSVADLAKYVTGVTDVAGSVTYNFGPNASITLVGLHASDLTADMIKFTI